MSGSIIAFPSSNVLRPPAGPAMRDRVRQLLASFAQEWRLRRDLAELQSMDARALHDIGLTRGSLESAVRNGRPRIRPIAGASDRWSPSLDRPLMPGSWTEWR